MASLGQFLYMFLELYIWLIIIRCILSFFPAINWYNQPWIAIRGATEPAMEPFRRIIPSIGGLDLSPIVLFFLLRILQGMIRSTMMGSGL